MNVQAKDLTLRVYYDQSKLKTSPLPSEGNTEAAKLLLIIHEPVLHGGNLAAIINNFGSSSDPNRYAKLLSDYNSPRTHYELGMGLSPAYEKVLNGVLNSLTSGEGRVHNSKYSYRNSTDMELEKMLGRTQWHLPYENFWSDRVDDKKGLATFSRIFRDSIEKERIEHDPFRYGRIGNAYRTPIDMSIIRTIQNSNR